MTQDFASGSEPISHFRLFKICRAVHINYRYRGLLNTGVCLLAHVLLRFKIPLLEDFRLNQPRDKINGLDTDGILAPHELDLPVESISSSRSYQRTQVYEFRYVLESLKLQYESYQFIDYGSGKGAIITTAAQYPFDSVTGIEISSQLHEIARKNIDVLYDRKLVACGNLISLPCNALDFRIPASPHVLYLYNPFSAEILKTVLEQLERTLTNVQKPSYLIYNRAVHANTISESKFFRKISEPMGGYWKVYSTQ